MASPSPEPSEERANWLNPALVDWLLTDNTPEDVSAITSLVANCWPVDFARNGCVERALNASVDWMLILDNDMATSSAVFKTIALADAKGLDILGFAYPILTDYGLCPSVILGEVSGANDDPDFEEVPEFGSGCIAIRISVFQRLTGPFFKIGIDPTKAHQGLGQAMGEDIAFCRAARNKGFRTISREENIRKRIILKRCHFFK